MKYTDYIINGNLVDLESVVPRNGLLKIITIPILSTAALAGLFIFGAMLPMTYTIDSTRYIKLQYIRTKRKYKVKYIIYIPIDKAIYAIDRLGYIIQRDEKFLRFKLIHLWNYLDNRNILFNFVRNYDKDIHNKPTKRY